MKLRVPGLVLIMLLSIPNSFSQRVRDSNPVISRVDVVISSSIREDGELPYTTNFSWDHFLGQPDNRCDFIAMTYSGIKMRYEYSTRNGITTARVVIFPYMDMTQSWFKDEALNAETLEHEQRHFDITAIVANEFAEEIKRHRFYLSSFPREMQRMHDNVIMKLEKRQRDYDEETDHGILSDRQAKWNRLVMEKIRQAEYIRI
jgi:hypothetical protein